MSWRTEIIDRKITVLLVGNKKNSFIFTFRKYLLQFNSQIVLYLLEKTPNEYRNFNYIFEFIGEKVIFFDTKNERKKTIEFTHGNILDKKNFEKILWFCFSSSKINKLKIFLLKKMAPKKQSLSRQLINQLSQIVKKKFILIVFCLLFLFFTSFLYPLLISYFFYYYEAKQNLFKKIEQKNTTDYLKKADSYLLVSKKLYSYPRPIFHFLGVGMLTDNLIDLAYKLNILFLTIKKGKYIGDHLINSLTTNDRRNKEIIVSDFNNLKNLLVESENSLNKVKNKLPFFLKNNSRYQELVNQIESFFFIAKKILPLIPNILGEKNEKKYLLLFANNRELRPGGGFIGSFAIIKVKDFFLENIKIYDVYDADGQLKFHIEPPEPIKNYLSQPHWFLRDSAFSPDFLENFSQAEFFLKNEIKEAGFDGGFLITTSAIENILKAFNSLYLPDLKEKITSDNFYLKTQYYTEKNFFPGSIQKKSFLNSLTKQFLINLENVSFINLLSQFKKSLDEKQIVIYFKNENTQKIFDELLWSGKVTFSSCLIKNILCLSNYLFPFDANLGVNKADYFVDKSIFYKIKINKNGEINHLLTFNYRNNLTAEVFPGGKYKNYFQIYLPKNIKITEILKDDTIISDFDQKEEKNLLLIGFYFEVKPKETAEIKIIFSNNETLVGGKNLFQILIQKQIGAQNKDFILQINLPNNINLISNNFIPLVKGQELVYNFVLNTDKLFYLLINKN